MEFDTWSDLEEMRLLVNHLPGLGQIRHEAHRLAIVDHLEQAVIDVIVNLDRAQ